MNDKFSQKAKTFALRSYWNFWNSGNSSEAYKILFEMGFSDKTMQDFAIGWNNKSIKRSASSFGIEGDMVEIPKGIVVPHLIAKSVAGLRVFSTELKPILRLPEDKFPPLIFSNKKRVTIVFSSVFQGYKSFQNLSDKVNTIIAEDMDSRDIKEIMKTSEHILIEQSLHASLQNTDSRHLIFSDYSECLKLLENIIM